VIPFRNPTLGQQIVQRYGARREEQLRVLDRDRQSKRRNDRDDRGGRPSTATLQQHYLAEEAERYVVHAGVA